MLETIKKVLGGGGEAKKLKEMSAFVTKVNALEEATKALSDDALKAKTGEFKKRLAEGTTLDDLLPEAFAAVREASRRTLGQRHFDVQIIGGALLHGGGIAEMRTGEGKTLVATLPAYLNALEGKGVHVVTVNDYLSRRDAVWMGEIYNALGLSVGILNHDTSFLYDPAHTELDKKRDEEGSFHVVHEFLRPCSRREAYEADITYGTNSEFGFDYLRDNLEYDQSRLRQRDYHFAIVDEIDSILIDEARTPLIISAPAQESERFYTDFARIAQTLVADTDFKVDEKHRTLQMLPPGIEKAEKALGVENIYTEKGIKYVHHLETAARAKALYTLNKDYVVKDGQIVIVDEFTGRMQPGRRWSEGLHQAIEAKEGVTIQRESRTYASITYQNFFRQYKKLAGMTGTAATSSEEFFKVYGLDVLSIPTNRPIARIDHNDQIFQTEQGKFKAVAKKIKEINAKGQPVLVGTVSIERNELLSAYLKKEGIAHEVLNAKNHEREGEIIAEAGKKGRVTIATNLAGRGVDIKLGGALATETEREEVKALGGLFVLGTERHEARRIDNQLRGRSGRQGDPGETQFFVSLEDSLMRIFASDTIKKMMGRLGVAEDEAIENKLITRSLETAQEKIEGFHFDARKHVLEYDDVLNIQRKSVYERRRRLLVGDAEVSATELSAIVGTDEALQKIILEKETKFGKPAFYGAIRHIFLQAIDMFWVDHLEAMDYMRSSVGLRAYGQRDPLVEYKREGLRLFREMEEGVNAQVLALVPNIGAEVSTAVEKEMQAVQKSAGEAQDEHSVESKPRTEDGQKIGRNDPCYCGSGKKLKNCHGK